MGIDVIILNYSNIEMHLILQYLRHNHKYSRPLTWNYEFIHVCKIIKWNISTQWVYVHGMYILWDVVLTYLFCMNSSTSAPHFENFCTQEHWFTKIPQLYKYGMFSSWQISSSWVNNEYIHNTWPLISTSPKSCN